ncbi:MAG: hypothetical protein EZS28_049922, partial [Streblomastix strix]
DTRIGASTAGRRPMYDL